MVSQKTWNKDRMASKTGKVNPPVWIKKGQTAKVGPTPSGLTKLADQYHKLNSTPNLVDSVGNGRIEHDDMNNPKGIASKKAPAMKPAMGKLRKPKGC